MSDIWNFFEYVIILILKRLYDMGQVKSMKKTFKIISLLLLLVVVLFPFSAFAFRSNHYNQYGSGYNNGYNNSGEGSYGYNNFGGYITTGYVNNRYNNGYNSYGEGGYNYIFNSGYSPNYYH